MHPSYRTTKLTVFERQGHSQNSLLAVPTTEVHIGRFFDKDIAKPQTVIDVLHLVHAIRFELLYWNRPVTCNLLFSASGFPAITSITMLELFMNETHHLFLAMKL